jgi:hypothetical protein
MNEVYCPSCRGLIPSDASICPLCGKPATARLRMETETLEQEAMRRAVVEAQVRAAEEQEVEKTRRVAAIRPDVNLSHLTDKQKALYLQNSGMGVCPGCRSQNLKGERISIGGSPGCGAMLGIGAAIGFFIVGPFCFWFVGGPIAAGFFGILIPVLMLLPIPFLKGTKMPYRRCNYCGHLWQV